MSLHEQLVDASPLKNEIADSVDIMVVRELIGGWIFFTFNKDLNVYHDWHPQACLYTDFGIDQIHFISYCFVNLACVSNFMVLYQEQDFHDLLIFAW